MPGEKNRPNLLLVEDSEDDAFFFERALEKSGTGCALHHAKDGAEAIEYLQNLSHSDVETLPPVMFLDLKMPVVNGFEVMEWLNGQSFASRIRVIVLSGSEHQTDKERAAQLGAADYVVKPIRATDLNRFLKDVCPLSPEVGALV
jgi:CheY-like chemotaxis protein